jgi:hypothetical protein
MGNEGRGIYLKNLKYAKCQRQIGDVHLLDNIYLQNI